MTEERAAQILNVTVAMLLGALAVGFFAWVTATQFASVRTIFRSLSSVEQQHITEFAGSVLMMATVLALGVRTLLAWRSHPVAAAILHALQTWGVIAGTGAFLVLIGNRTLGAIWLAVAGVVFAVDLVKRWRTPRAPASINPG